MRLLGHRRNIHSVFLDTARLLLLFFFFAVVLWIYPLAANYGITIAVGPLQ